MKTALQAVWDSALQKFSPAGAPPPFAAEAKADFEAWASSPAGEEATLQEATQEAEFCLAAHRAGERWWHNHSRDCSTKYRGCAPDCPKAQREREEESTAKRDLLVPAVQSLLQLLAAVHTWREWREKQSDADEMAPEERDLSLVFEHVKEKLA